MNQFVLLAIAVMDVRAQMEGLRARARRAEDGAIREGKSPCDLLRGLLERAPDVEPDPEDRHPKSNCSGVEELDGIPLHGRL